MIKRVLEFILFGVLTLSLLTGCIAEEKAELILTNGLIYTVDGENWHNEPRQAVAIDRDGKILFTGSSSEVNTLPFSITISTGSCFLHECIIIINTTDIKIIMFFILD